MEQQLWRLTWNDAMSVGIPEIDEEHKHFIALINDLNQSILERMDITEVKNKMQMILADAQHHFAHEEMLFKKWAYPDADIHAQKHAEVMQAYRAIMEKLSDSLVEPDWISAGLKVKNILVEHLVKEDMKYRDYRRAQQHDEQNR